MVEQAIEGEMCTGEGGEKVKEGEHVQKGTQVMEHMHAQLLYNLCIHTHYIHDTPGPILLWHRPCTHFLEI